MRTLFTLVALFVLVLPRLVYCQGGVPDERDSEILEKFDFFDSYGNQGKDVDEENSTIIFLHQDPKDGTRSYKSYRIEERVPEENVFEYHLKPERSNDLVDKYSETYKTYDDTKRKFNEPKAIESFTRNHDKGGSSLTSGSFRYRLNHLDRTRVFKAERFIIGEGPDDSVIYRVEITFPNQPFEYNSLWQLPPLPEHLQSKYRVDVKALKEEAKQMMSEWDENEDKSLNLEEFDKWTTQFALDWESDNELSRKELETMQQDFIDSAPSEPKIPTLPQFRLPEHLSLALKVDEDEKLRSKFELDQKEKFEKNDVDASNGLSVDEFSAYLLDVFSSWIKEMWSDSWSDTFEWTELQAKPKDWQDVTVFEPTAEEWREYRTKRRQEADLRQWSQEFTEWKKFVNELDPLKEMKSKDFIARWDATADKELNSEELSNWLNWFTEALAFGIDTNAESISELEIPESLLSAARVVEDESLWEELEKSKEQRFVKFDEDDSETLSATELVGYLTELFSD